MMTKPTILVLAVILGLASGGCSLLERLRPQQPEPLLSASPVEGDPTRLRIQFSGCDGDPGLEIEEDETEVRITLQAQDTGCEPLHGLEVQLEGPLGDRTVIDGATGEPVPESFGAG